MAEAQRRLAAIMFTDIVGYTALTQQDEALSMELLAEHNRLLRPLFRKYGGKEIKTIGDAFHIEFSSALDAVRCAIECQQVLSEHNVSVPEERQVRIRIGIHVGDVVPQGGDIYGEAVNIAARIQPLAEPGGVLISGQVYDHVHNKVEAPLVNLGKPELKNVTVPIEVYRVLLPWEKGARSSATVAGDSRAKRLRLAALVGVPAVLLVAFFLWWFASPYFVNHVPTATPSATTQNDVKSIAVLPFDNVNADPNNEYFSDGMTDELTNALSRLQGLRVIARSSAFAFKGKEEDVRQIGAQLNVQTVLEGSVQKAGDKVRISVQLVKTNDGFQLWSNTYDRQLGDVFSIQDDITQALVGALKITLTGDQKGQLVKSSSVNSDVYNLYLLGRYDEFKYSAEGYKQAAEYFAQALATDPNYALAYVGLADCYNSLPYLNPQSFPQKQYWPKAKVAIQRALELDDTLAEAHAIYAEILPLVTQNDASVVEAEYKRALELNPSYAEAHRLSAAILHYTDHEQEAFMEIQLAHQLDPLSAEMSAILGFAFYLHRQYDQAIDQELKALDLDPNNNFASSHLGFIYIAQSEPQKALEEFQKVQKEDAGTLASDKFAIGYAYAKLGRRDEAEKVLNELKEREKSYADMESPYVLSQDSGISCWIAYLYLGLGQTDQFFHYATRCGSAMQPILLEDPALIAFEPMDPINDSIRSDARFDQLLSVVRSDNAAWQYYYERQYDQAVEQEKRTLTMDPNFAYAYRVMALSALKNDEYDEALMYLQKMMNLENSLDLETGKWWQSSYLGYTYAKLGRRNEAETVISDLKNFLPPEDGARYLIATVYLGLGEMDQVFSWLQQGYQNGSVVPFDLKYNPIWDSIRTDLRFIDLLNKAGLGD
jgi:TolB-like protein/class 3 adenylate cyclase/Tfp pilus assembly protein PilF